MQGRGRHRSSSSSLACTQSVPSSQEKPLHQLRRPHKKFSLANAFPLTSPRSCHQDGQRPAGAIHQPPNCHHSTVNDDKCQFGQTNIFSPRFRPRKGSEPQPRKSSAPVDYRDSGVYLGETDRDPVMEMWNKSRERDDSFSKKDEQKLQSSFVPANISANMQSDGYNRHVQTRASPLDCTALSDSLPAIDSTSLKVDPGECKAACGERGVSKLSGGRSGNAYESIERHGRLCEPSSQTGSVSGPMFKKTKLHWLSQRVSTGDLLESIEGANESEEQFTPSDSPLASSKSQSLTDRECTSQIEFNIDESTDPAFLRQRATRTKSSFYRRSRSLAEEDTGKMITVEDTDLPQSADPFPVENNSRSDYGPDKTRGRDKERKKGAMMQAHSESESIASERKISNAKKKRSLADPIAKLTLTLLRRKGNSLTSSPALAAGGNGANQNANSNFANSSPSFNSPPKVPSREEVRKWASSFEHLLDHRYGVMLFRTFLQREFSEENIDFWIACEEYKKLRDTKFAVQARQIYNDFVAVQAPKEVNLDSVTRSTTMAALSNPNRRTFEQAQHRIQSLMEKDSYPRFLRSDLYLDLARKC